MDTEFPSKSHSNAVYVTAGANLPTRYGDFLLQSFNSAGLSAGDKFISEPDFKVDRAPILALSTGLDSGKTPLVRLHSECVTGEVFASLRCDCNQQLEDSMARIQSHGCGAIIYLRQEGRGIGIENKIRAYSLQDKGLDTVDANLALGLPIDARDFSSAAMVLVELGIKRCNLLSNNPDKAAALRAAGIGVDSEVALLVEGQHASCIQYLNTKRERLGHRL